MRRLLRPVLLLVALCLPACSSDSERTAGQSAARAAPAAAPAQTGSQAGGAPTGKPGNALGTPGQAAPTHSTSSSGCLGDEGGCRAKVLDFLPCEGDVASARVTLDTLFADPAAHVGKQLALIGPLVKRGAECTEGACERTCCNTCTSVVTIGDADSGRYVHLVSAETPGLYLCRGDESLLCCQFEADGRQVVAQGAFEMTRGVTPPVYQLFVTELCAPEPAAEPAAESAP